MNRKKKEPADVRKSPEDEELKDEYDSPWKDVIQQYFEDFLLFFFPYVHKDIDWSREYEFLDSELRKITKDAKVGRRHVDVFVKVWLKNGKSLWVLIHIEVQSQHDKNFPKRNYIYHRRASEKYNVDVANLVILGDDSEKWRPKKYIESIWKTKLTFQFPVVKLLDYRKRLKWLEKNDNPFATVVLAHLKTKETKNEYTRRGQEKIAIMRKLYAKGYSKKDVQNLFDFIDWVMFLPEEEEELFHQELEQLDRLWRQRKK